MNEEQLTQVRELQTENLKFQLNVSILNSNSFLIFAFIFIEKSLTYLKHQEV